MFEGVKAIRVLRFPGRGPAREATSIAALLAALVVPLVASLPAAGSPRAVAVIVNAANPLRDPTFEELRSIFKLEQQEWEAGRRIELVLPPAGSLEERVLLDAVYRQSEIQLRKTWARRMYAGEIPTVPSAARSAGAVVTAVKRSRNAIGVVSVADGIPKGVRVLSISGKRPGEPGYPLAVHGS
jgi:ABC-type phosphate transport system substrate-binding protein